MVELPAHLLVRPRSARARVWARRWESVPFSMMLPPKVSRSTIAAHSRGSVKVLVQPEKDSLDAIATLAFSSRSVRT
jgi:hypothetical protein